MKLYESFEITQGFETWKTMYIKIKPKLESYGIVIRSYGCEESGKKMHLFLEVDPSRLEEVANDSELQATRVTGGVNVDSQIKIPLQDEWFIG